MAKFKSRLSVNAGKIKQWQKDAYGINGQTGHAFFKLQFYTTALIRVTLTRDSFFEDFSYSVITQPLGIEFNVDESDAEIRMSTVDLTIRVLKENFRLIFENSNGERINADDELGTCWNGDQVSTYKQLQAGERFIGLGEKTGPLDRRGYGYQHWNTDSYAYNPASDPLYCSTPFYIGIHSGLCYGIYLDNTFKSFFNFGASNDRFASFAVDAGDMDYYFFQGKSIPEIIESYTSLTGKMPLPPRWSIGYQQCRYSYFPDKEVLTVANTFREKDIPADVIVLDIHYMDSYKIFTWHKDHFSDPKKLMEQLQQKGFEVVIMCDPGIKVEEGYPAYDDGVKQDVFIKYPDGKNYSGQVWPGWCHFPDFTKSNTRTWWKEKFKDYVALGIRGFWNDMNEIATWGNQLPENLEMDFEGNKDTIRRGRNIYGFQMARATYEGTKILLKGYRPFNLTRSGFSGIQRYAAVWTGDNIATDEHMMLGVRLVNSMGITGIAFCGYDAGGFVGDAHPKLFSRWISIASFSPFFRGHSMINSRDAEPWSFGEETEEISRNYIKLRYRMMPYLYSAFYEASQTGMPVNRSMAIYYPHHELVYARKYQHQYFFGPSLLVAPVESSRDMTKVFLPEGKWYGLFDDQHYDAGEVFVECPVEKLPVFVKASSILVMDGEQLNSTKQTSHLLEIHVYQGNSDCTFKLYQDDGSTFEYEQGNFSIQEIQFSPALKKLTINAPNGAFLSPYQEINVFFHGFKLLKSVTVNDKTTLTTTSDYRFVQPLRSFDPMVTHHEGYRIHDLQSINVKYSNEPTLINWEETG